MKNTKKGYTLAEILITLGVIAIVSALVVPSLFNNTKEQTYEPAAQRTAVVLEEAIVEIIQRAQGNSEDAGAVTTLSPITVRDVTGANSDDFISTGTTLFDALRSIMGTEALSAADRNSYIRSVRNADGTAVVNWGAYNVYKVKKVNTYVTVIPVPAANASRNDDGELTRIYIDANGDKAPNRIYNRANFPGGDIFEYILMNSGHILRVQ